MRRIISIILLIVMLLSITVSYASDDQFEVEKKYAEFFLAKLGYSYELTSPTPLYNFDDELEAVVFSIGKTGYIIINSNDLSIPEFSIKTKNPYDKDSKSKLYYNGPLQYYIKDSKHITHIKTDEKISNNKIKHKYKREKVNKDLKLRNATLQTNIGTMSIYEEYYEINLPLRTWSTYHYCGVDATAILLQFYDDHYDDAFVPSSVEGEYQLTDYLVNMKYIYDGGTNGYDLVNGVNGTTGIDGYLDSHGLDHNANRVVFLYSTAKTRIHSGDAIITGVIGHPEYNNHWVIAYGYAKPAGEVPYLIVNDGWGSNDIYISTDYNDEIVYID